MKIIYLDVDFNDENSGVYTNTLVVSPASEDEMVLLSDDFIDDEIIQLSDSENIEIHLSNDEKRIMTGIMLKADFPMPRKGGYSVAYKKEAVLNVMKKWAKDNMYKNMKETHDENGVELSSQVHLIESYIVDENKKYKNTNVGSWVVSYWVEDEKYWNEVVKAGKYKGFSLEGIFKRESNLRLSDDKDIIGEDVLKYLETVGEEIDETWELMVDVFDLESNIIQKLDSSNDLWARDMSGKYLVRYRYDGPKDDKNRTFCAKLLELNKVYTEEEIKIKLSNEEFGDYSCWTWKGSFNCRHRWKREIYFRKIGSATEIKTNIYDKAVTSTLTDEQATRVNEKVQYELIDLMLSDISDSEKEAKMIKILNKFN